MRITFHASHYLPRGRHVAIAEGDGECTIFLGAGYTPEEQAHTRRLARALTNAIQPWADARWCYMGDMMREAG